MMTLREYLLWPIALPLAEARKYSVRKFRGDLIAGLTVAVVAVPQSMAYALIAGINPIYGLYGAIIQVVLGALLGSSNHLVTGPINTLSLITASAVSRLAEGDAQLYLEMVFMLTLMSGLIQMAFAVTRMGGLVKYVSHSVIVGFTAGAGVLIAARQVAPFLGIATEQAPKRLPGLLGVIEQVWPRLHQIDHQAIIVGLAALAIVIISVRISRMVPGPLLAVLAGSIIVVVSGWTDGQVKLVGELPRASLSEIVGLPNMSWEMAEALFGGALAVALVGMVEAFGIGKAIADRTGQTLQSNKEFFAQGLTNTISSCFHCMPGSGSFSRSALNHAAGARTCFAAIMCGGFVLLIFLLFAGPAKYIPYPALAAVLFVISYGLIDWRYFIRVARSSHADALVVAVTFLATILVPLEFAIFIGVFVNFALYVHKASQLQMSEMVPLPTGPFLERPIRDKRGNQAVVFLQTEGALFFGVADELRDRLTELSHSPARVVIIRLKRTLSVDATVLGVIERFIEEMRRRDGYVLLCGVKPELETHLRSYGLVRLLGEENFFVTSQGIFASATQALRRAKHLVGTSLDTSDLPRDVHDGEEWCYEI